MDIVSRQNLYEEGYILTLFTGRYISVQLSYCAEMFINYDDVFLAVNRNYFLVQIFFYEILCYLSSHIVRCTEYILVLQKE